MSCGRCNKIFLLIGWRSHFRSWIGGEINPFEWGPFIQMHQRGVFTGVASATGERFLLIKGAVTFMVPQVQAINTMLILYEYLESFRGLHLRCIAESGWMSFGAAKETWRRRSPIFDIHGKGSLPPRFECIIAGLLFTQLCEFP